MNEQPQPVFTGLYDEMIPVGRDFRSRDVVDAYDAYHRRFRNVEAENDAIIASLGLERSQTVADFGSGTGAFALHAARRCAKVHAIDVSKAMLDYTAWKAEGEGVTNIVCHHAGFLTYVHTDPPLDAITSSMALHHLPDFWKQKALARLHGMLRPGGRLLVADVVFSEQQYETRIARWIEQMTARFGPDMAADLTRHVCTEYSTFAWIMDGLLLRAGFRIDHVEHTDGVLARYVCSKVAE